MFWIWSLWDCLFELDCLTLFCFFPSWFWAKWLALFCSSIKQISLLLGPSFQISDTHWPNMAQAEESPLWSVMELQGPSWRVIKKRIWWIRDRLWSVLQHELPSSRVNSNRFGALNPSLRHQRPLAPIYLRCLQWKILQPMLVSLQFVNLLLFNVKLFSLQSQTYASERSKVA